MSEKSPDTDEFKVNATPAGLKTRPLFKLMVERGASDLFFELWGPEHGAHARSAIGVAELPRRSILEIVGEFELYPERRAPRRITDK